MNSPLPLQGGAPTLIPAPPCRGSCRRLRGSRPPMPDDVDRIHQLHFARRLRRDATEAERYLWRHLRRRNLNGHRFRRQHPIGPYVADFACLHVRLIIELDGGQHAASRSYDAQRDVYLAERGFRVLRFWDHDVLTDVETVMDVIRAAMEEGPPQPAPAPPARGSGERVAAIPERESGSSARGSDVL